MVHARYPSRRLWWAFRAAGSLLGERAARKHVQGSSCPHHTCWAGPRRSVPSSPARDPPREVWVSGVDGPTLRCGDWRHPEDVEFPGDVRADCPGGDAPCSGPPGAQCLGIPPLSSLVCGHLDSCGPRLCSRQEERRGRGRRGRPAERALLTDPPGSPTRDFCFYSPVRVGHA